MSGAGAPDLRSRLDAVWLEEDPWYRDLISAIAARLRTTACEGVLGPGETMPDFVLADAHDDLVFSGDLLVRGPLVVCFFRGDWCPFCATTLHALDEILDELHGCGATLVAITPDVGDYVAALRDEQGIRFPVLCDIGNAVGLQFGTVYHVPHTLHEGLLQYDIDLAARHGGEASFLPMPATFIAGRDGVLRFVHVSGDVRDRAEPRAILREVRALVDAGS